MALTAFYRPKGIEYRRRPNRSAVERNCGGDGIETIDLHIVAAALNEQRVDNRALGIKLRDRIRNIACRADKLLASEVDPRDLIGVLVDLEEDVFARRVHHFSPRVTAGLKHLSRALQNCLDAVRCHGIDAQAVDALLIVVGNAVVDDVVVAERNAVVALGAVVPAINLDFGAENAGLQIDAALIKDRRDAVVVSAEPVVVKLLAVGAEALEAGRSSHDSG